MKITDLKASDYNPRTIDADALDGLKRSLEHFGDISGVVLNTRTGRLVAGHQRVRALRELHGDELEVVRPKRGQDVGRVRVPDGDDVRVRFVDWDESTERAANIAANNPHIAGTFTDDLADVLSTIELELPEMVQDLRLDALVAVPDLPGGYVGCENDAGPQQPEPPDGFKELDEDTVQTEHECPVCKFRW